MKNFLKVIFLLILFYSCQTNPNRNDEDIRNVRKGMHYKEVQKIMRNKYDRTYDKHKYRQTIPVFTHYYLAPFGASGDFEIRYEKNDSIVVSMYLGN